MSSDHSPFGLSFSEPPAELPVAVPAGRPQSIDRVPFQQPPADEVEQADTAVTRLPAERMTFSSPERQG